MWWTRRSVFDTLDFPFHIIFSVSLSLSLSFFPSFHRRPNILHFCLCLYFIHFIDAGRKLPKVWYTGLWDILGFTCLPQNPYCMLNHSVNHHLLDSFDFMISKNIKYERNLKRKKKQLPLMVEHRAVFNVPLMRHNKSVCFGYFRFSIIFLVGVVQSCVFARSNWVRPIRLTIYSMYNGEYHSNMQWFMQMGCKCKHNSPIFMLIVHRSSFKYRYKAQSSCVLHTIFHTEYLSHSLQFLMFIRPLSYRVSGIWDPAIDPDTLNLYIKIWIL